VQTTFTYLFTASQTLLGADEDGGELANNINRIIYLHKTQLTHLIETGTELNVHF